MDISKIILIFIIIWTLLSVFWIGVIISSKLTKADTSKLVSLQAKKILKYNLVYLVIALLLGIVT